MTACQNTGGILRKMLKANHQIQTGHFKDTGHKYSYPVKTNMFYFTATKFENK